MAADPRPLTGEPVALDLLNTRWTADGEPLDLFAGAAGLTRVEGVAVWLESAGLAGRFRADAPALVHLLTAREALARAMADPADASARALLDAVLEHGRIRVTLTAEGRGERAEFADPAWGPAWTAVRDYLELLGSAPGRIRTCASGDCALRFRDDSPDGTRLRCGTAACGDRA
ncbi:CGNR zinc finger domain-containing protein [Streptomyces antarcticus]|uniref:CGNR zinc finger domain-containing protein n=1 Tax=Streptomyces antarcticus TaxID=2996458 RepID=UPI00226E3743|nr:MULTISPECIES: ABATE domain-containing protein [unclassified Streptomyces]MCY0943679.1 ABATE domain-containing protein [Streptomyces sp. H34-AA3]MCY0948873.1 ABATE domain-containing protein [Streptomyces sp. H27-S2]MCZ4084242.1 ABATE domain-containing protein [Streptomyces sp. H34-S5]